MLLAERLARPFQRGAGRVVEIGSARFNGLVVIAFEDYRAFRGVPDDDLNHFPRIGAIPDQITKKDEPLRAAAPSVVQTRVQGLEVAVNVG